MRWYTFWKYSEGEVAVQDEWGRGRKNISLRNRHAQMHVHVKEISHLLGERDKGQWDWWEVSE